jgi:hypothetical protein
MAGNEQAVGRDFIRSWTLSIIAHRIISNLCRLDNQKPGKVEIRGFVFNFQSLLFAYFPKCGDQQKFLNSLETKGQFDLSNARVHRHPKEINLERRNKKRPFCPPQRFKLKLEWEDKVTEPSSAGCSD